MFFGVYHDFASLYLDLRQDTEAKRMSEESKMGELPFAQGRRFATLEEYLTHLENRGAHDVPWYRQVAPDVFELVSGRGRGPVQRFTRAELAARFGFGESGAA